MSQNDDTQNETENGPPVLRSSFAFVDEDEGGNLRDEEGEVFDVAVNEAIQEVEEIPIGNQEDTEPQTPQPESDPIETTSNHAAETPAPIPEATTENVEPTDGHVTPPEATETPPEDKAPTDEVEPLAEPVAEENAVSEEETVKKAPKKIEPEETEEEEITEISFIVKTPAGKKFNLKLEPDTSIDEVKETLAKMENQELEAKEIKLILRGKPLNNGAKTIKQVGIMKGMKVYMIKQLYGANGAANSKVGPSIQRSTEGQRGFITITIPEGARPGNRLIIHPPGRQRMVVYVPRGMGPGDALRVQLPNAGGAQANTNNPRPGQTQGIDPSQALQNSNMTYKTVLKAVCPQDGRPGQEVRINVPNVGVLKVSIPATARPGQPFYFRIPPL